MILRDDLMALDYLSSRPEVDARRLGQLVQIFVWREFVGLRQHRKRIGSYSAFTIFDSSELLLAYPRYVVSF